LAGRGGVRVDERAGVQRDPFAVLQRVLEVLVASARADRLLHRGPRKYVALEGIVVRAGGNRQRHQSSEHHRGAHGWFLLLAGENPLACGDCTSPDPDTISHLKDRTHDFAMWDMQISRVRPVISMRPRSVAAVPASRFVAMIMCASLAGCGDDIRLPLAWGVGVAKLDAVTLGL